MPRGRVREFDRSEALGAALLLFWRKGYNATSMRDLSESLGIGVPSLYGSFRSKEALFVEAVERYMGVARTYLWQPFEKLSAREAIEGVLRITSGELSAVEKHPAGCLITAAFVDEDMPELVAKAIRESRNEWRQAIEDRLRKGVDDGDLPQGTDVVSLGRFYSGIIQTVGIQAHDGATPQELDKVVDIAMTAWPA